MITVTSRKYYSQDVNGMDFSLNLGDYTTNLVGAAGEKKRSVITFDQYVGTVPADSGDIEIDGTTLIRTTGSYINEDWRAGYEGRATSVIGGVTFTFRITAISLAEDVITFDLLSGIATPATYTDLVLEITSDLLACVFRYGLIENSEGTNFTNKVDSSEMMYQLNGILTGATLTAMNYTGGAVSWYTGPASIRRTGAVTAGVAEYEIVQDFIIPYYIQSWMTDILAHTLPTDLWQGTKTLKHVWDIVFRQALSNPNYDINYTDDSILGSAGFFGENYNGFGNNYTFALTSYTDTLTGDVVAGLQINRKTTVNFTITSAAKFTSSSRIAIYGSSVRVPLDYTGKTTEFIPIWNYDSLTVTAGTNNTGTGTITRLDSTVDNTSLITCEADFEFTAAQQLLLYSDTTKLLLVDQFMIWGLTADPLLTAAASDKAGHVLDVCDLVRDTDVADLFNVTSFEVLKHDCNLLDGGYSNVSGYIEEGMMARLRFTLDLNNGAYLKRLRMQTYAFNSSTGEGFPVTDYDVDLSSGVLIPTGSPGISKQAFSLDTTRGYRLPSGDFMNRVRLAEYIDESPFRWGQYDFSVAGLLDVLLKAHNVETGYLNPDYTLLLHDPYGAGFDYVNDVNLSSEFQVTALSGFPGAAIRYFAIKNDASAASTLGVAWGEETLAAGANTITFDIALLNSNYAVFAMDVSGNGFHTIVKSAGSFTIQGLAAGIMRYVAIKYTGVTGIQAGSQAITAGSNTITFANTLGSTDFTWIYKTWENWSNNIVETGRTATSVTFTAEVAGTIDSIAILNS